MVCVAGKNTVMLRFIDMDGLKRINDNYGHDEGDFAIQKLADVIKDCCKQGSICARFGGDEFVIFDTNANADSPELLAKKFNAKIESKNDIIRKPYRISASIGSYLTQVDETYTLYRIIKTADELMYEVKKNKKNSRTGSERQS
ncbi:MAG: GGDEF domain-containing protein, partial [Ruminococcus sp.]|nr:GGDEF domain-containing protein [Ruminococcus sp.]